MSVDQSAITVADTCVYCDSREQLVAQPIFDGNAGYIVREVTCAACRLSSAEIELAQSLL